MPPYHGVMAWCPELTSLRLLHTVGQTGSISEAARVHGVSQPAASKRLRTLERSMGVHLVQRTPSGSQLTDEGRVAADWAGRVFDTIEQMLDAIGAIKAHGTPDLRLASSMTIAEHLVPEWLSVLRRREPDTHVGLRVTNSQEVQRLVLEGHVDIGLVETPTIAEQLDSMVIGSDRLVVIVPPSHEWAARESPLTTAELGRSDLIVREQGSGTREALDHTIGDVERVEPVLELGSNAAVKGAVTAGAGAAVLSGLAVNHELVSGQLVEVAVVGINLERTLSAVWQRGRSLDDLDRAFLQIAATTSI